ncbi:hypothetical protein ACIQCJ_30515 [Streptomyces sp. NPDC093221]|uniref:hypothetical protein n=1 Tax=Streptomyces sp. NPDC093221 TaxID=3366032 RepID=UPI00382273FF
MAEIWDEQELIGEGFERVFAELDRYDAPIFGLAEVEGEPHYFRLVYEDTYAVWPVGAAQLVLERERWALFAAWHARYEAGTAEPDTHPGTGGVDARYDELTALLLPHRDTPAEPRVLTAQWRSTPGPRYRPDGVDYRVRWRPAD